MNYQKTSLVFFLDLDSYINVPQGKRFALFPLRQPRLNKGTRGDDVNGLYIVVSNLFHCSIPLLYVMVSILFWFLGEKLMSFCNIELIVA